MVAFVKRMKIQLSLIGTINFFPLFLQWSCFTIYIALGNKLDIASAMTVISVLSIVSQPVRRLPVFLGQFIEFLVAMQRIEKFLEAEEVQPGVLKKWGEDNDFDDYFDDPHLQSKDKLSVDIVEGSNLYWDDLVARDAVEDVVVNKKGKIKDKGKGKDKNKNKDKEEEEADIEKNTVAQPKQISQ